MAIVDEFKKFIARGNVLDLAVGVMIGAAFGKIVSSLNENMIMPVIGWLFGSIDFSKYFFQLGDAPADYKGSLTDYAALKAAGVPMIGYGEFITQVVNFLIIAFVLFLLVRSVNKMIDSVKKQEAEAAAAAPAPEAPVDPQLIALKEILEELRKPKA
ncbi:mechanosensitive channel [Sphingomonas sp. LH128]|jgi:large conductance mechanosensitive channel|uniref:Large-conductance mechanosensitive channel n=1 Tax=Novosphingobium resinovorum TaxID=158500 RepID=A0A031K6A7_9SPHN|nr:MULTISPECIES: large conductance mechanosensitive channel protein MscL [Sphingomonadaceae]EJU12222.1 mechanosensitive channel [Sphingomonas sp. LH128]EZP84543.1 Large-conductance mechanosensitive channel [Novosphingobium resinovorum]